MTNFYCTCDCDPFGFWDITTYEYLNLTSIERMAFLRSLRLHLIEQKRKDKNDRRLKEHLVNLWIKGAET
jgi:hypothetical protein